jgi:hypothetical protein
MLCCRVTIRDEQGGCLYEVRKSGWGGIRRYGDAMFPLEHGRHVGCSERRGDLEDRRGQNGYEAEHNRTRQSEGTAVESLPVQPWHMSNGIIGMSAVEP